MNDDFGSFPGAETPAAAPREDHTLGASTIFKLCAEVIQLRERNDRTHRDFERTLAKTRDELKSSFDGFAAATQRAYQDLRKETVGEKKFSMDLLMLLLEISQDLEHITAVKPPPDDAEAVKRWIEAVEVETRKVQALDQPEEHQGTRGPARRAVRPQMAQARRQRAGRGHGAEPHRPHRQEGLRQPAARFRVTAAGGDCVGVGRFKHSVFSPVRGGGE